MRRDVVLALVLGILLVTGHRRALGWVLLVEALAAYGDMATVLAHRGFVATALGVHSPTATLMVVNGGTQPWAYESTGASSERVPSASTPGRSTRRPRQ
ncbi:DUF4267 domain-containing protein [Streptomyces sp. NPDC058316]|uniref:DUF4267 domain-containing protein n=1 Tax=unclassified Streptomyces TaxID=2593676 RepID=UPI003429B413